MRGFLALVLLLLASPGCELIAEFDRGKLDAGAAPTDAGKAPAEPDEPDAGFDADAGQ